MAQALKVVTVDSRLQAKLATESTVQGDNNRAYDIVHTCEISTKESHYGGIRRTIPLPDGGVFELDHPHAIEATAMLVYPGRGCQRPDGTRGSLLIEIQVPCVGGSDGARALGLDQCIADIAPQLRGAPAMLKAATAARVAAELELAAVKERNGVLQAQTEQLERNADSLRAELDQTQAKAKEVAAERKKIEDYATGLQATLNVVAAE
eukprot:COSAG03_NODE_449_length_7834_cov_7.818746_1_plen_207_part_10